MMGGGAVLMWGLVAAVCALVCDTVGIYTVGRAAAVLCNSLLMPSTMPSASLVLNPSS